MRHAAFVTLLRLSGPLAMAAWASACGDSQSPQAASGGAGGGPQTGTGGIGALGGGSGGSGGDTGAGPSGGLGGTGDGLAGASGEACANELECRDGIECTADSCVDSVCHREILPLGSSCTVGICTGQSGPDSCVRCVDNTDNGLDTGCNVLTPACDTSVSPAVCVACLTTEDCEDGNECTIDSCVDKRCNYETVLSGTPCRGGYCNGISGAENCLTPVCQTDSECDDAAECSSEFCTERHVCEFTVDHGKCPESGDVCKPNLCTVGTGCRQVDISESIELLENGNLEAGALGWTQMSLNYPQVIYPQDYIPSLRAHTEPNLAWLGGGEAGLDESNSLSQQVSVPSGTANLQLTFYYHIDSQALPDDQNQLQVYFRSVDGGTADLEIVTFHNQDRAPFWTAFIQDLDAAEWAGSTALLEFSGTAVGGFSNFYVDSISLLATVCQ